VTLLHGGKKSEKKSRKQSGEFHLKDLQTYRESTGSNMIAPSTGVGEKENMQGSHQ